MLMPAFHYFPKEASIIGRILAGFGDLELTLAVCAGTALAMSDTVLRTIFRIGSTAARIDAAEALAREAYAAIKLEREFSESIGAVRYCYSMRNQYAHCHWASHIHAGLFFTNLEAAAQREKGFEHQFKHTDIALLELQQNYFIFSMECLQYLDSQYPFRTGKSRVPPPFAWPPKQSLPPKHNPSIEHVPPWLTASQKQRHIMLAEEQERKGGKPVHVQKNHVRRSNPLGSGARKR